MTYQLSASTTPTPDHETLVSTACFYNRPFYEGVDRAVYDEDGTTYIGFGHALTLSERISGTVYGIPINDISLEDAVRILRTDISLGRVTAVPTEP